jgi:hypothetical protein
MAITVIDGVSGTKIEFPDGTDNDTISRVMRDFSSKQAPATLSPAPGPKEQFGPTREAMFQGPAEDVRARIAQIAPEGRNAALKEWAASRVQSERAALGGKRDDGVYRFSAGTPVGSWLDEGEAALQGGLHKISGGRFGAPYDETLAYERAKMAAIDADSKKLGSVTLPFVGDVGIYSGGLAKLAGGLASAPLAPALRVMQGTTMLPTMANAAATGGAYGAAYGAGDGETAGERGFNAAVGGGLGAGLGGAAAPIARGIGRLMTPDPALPGQLAGLNRKGVGMIADDLRADNLTAQRTAAEAARMGPEATLADMGNNVRTSAGAIARTQGEGRATVVDTLGRTVRDGRRGGADARIQQELNANLGAPVDTVALERNVVQQANQAARPHYQAFERQVIPDTPAIQRLQQRVAAAPGVMAQAERLMQLETGQPVAMNTGRAWDYIKRAVDDLGRNAQPGSNEARLYRGLATNITGTIDLMLQRRAGGSDWQTARNLAGVGQQFRSGLEEGRGAFSKAVTADQMRFDVGRMRPGERQGFQVGARDSIRQAADNASTMFGATGDASTMRMLNAPAAQDKLQQLVGPQAAQRIGNRLNTEADFELTRQAAVGNSVTAEMTAAQRRMGLNTATPQAETVAGMVKAAAKWATDKMVGGYRDERMRRMTGDMARVLMAQGGERDAIIRDLQTLIAAQGTRGTQRTIAEGVLKAMSDASRPLAIEQATR